MRLSKIMTLLFAACMLLLLFTGCTSKTEPKESMFGVGIDPIQKVQANQKFEIHGYVANNSKSSWKMNHGAGMFTYEIRDSEGNPVRQEYDILFRNDIGYSYELKPEQKYSNNGHDQRSKEFYEFVIDKPGSYTAISTAEFWIAEEAEKRIPFKIVSDSYDFVVE